MSAKLIIAMLFLLGVTLRVATYAVRVVDYLEKDRNEGPPYKLLALILGILLGYTISLGLLYALGEAWELGWRKW